MIEIMVTIHVRAEKGGQDKDVPLILETSAPVAEINPKSWTLGRWRCTSYYLGADLTGNYAVVNQHLRSGYNPTGLFYDSRESAPDTHDWPDDEDPFLLLWGFDSMTMKIGAEGEGKIIRTTMTDLQRMDVKWRRSK